MNRRRADRIVAVLVLGILAIGGALTWQAYQRRRALDRMMESMMGSSGMVHGTNPLWYALGTLLAAAVVGGLYLAVREELPAAGRQPTTTDVPEASADEGRVNGGIALESQSRTAVLDLLPDDERRVLEPVVDSPGITQIELRDRSDFSKSKVSQTVSELEKRGLLYRERQGRTYRIYPSDELGET